MRKKNECIFNNPISGKCSVLTNCFCNPEENVPCSFRKTSEQYEAERDKCILRCRNLKMCSKDIRCKYGNLCHTTKERWTGPDNNFLTVVEERK